MSIAPPDLPTGTVTFLMTDIEASTELVHRLGDGWPAVVQDQKRLVREAVAAAGGHEVDSRGEEFFFVFRRAQDAVAAAVAAQRSLAAHDWPENAVVRLRMGIHTGEPALGDDGGYLGLDVHRAARICAAGHGGQVLASESTRALALDADVRFVDLGEQEFKGFARPQRVYQLAAEGLPEGFPALVTSAEAPYAGEERALAKAAQSVVARGRPRLPALFRRQAPTARRLADVAWQLRSRQSAVREDERPALLELARSFVVLSRTTNDADRRLERLDRRTLERKLRETRELAVASRYAEKQADKLETSLALVDALSGARATLDDRIEELERRGQTATAAECAPLRVDVDALDDALSTALERVVAEVDESAERLHRTLHRGIYRQGDLWAIPFYDSQGVERVRRFDDVDEARAFRRRQQVVHRADKIAAEVSERRGLIAATGEVGIGGDADGGGGDGD